MPDKLFTNTPIAVSLWFLDKTRNKRSASEVLFIDASKAGYATSRTSNSIGEEESEEIATVYHQWRESGEVAGHGDRLRTASISLDQIRRDKFVLLPAAYMETSRDGDGSDLSLAEALQGPSLLSGLAVLGRLDGLAAEVSEEVEQLASDLDAADVEFVSIALSEILEPSKETLGDGREPEVLTCTEGAGLVLQRERFAKRVATESTAKYKVVRKGDIVYNPYLLWKGSIDQCWIVEEGITSPAYAVFHVREGYHRAIVGRLLTSAEMIRRYDGISFGTVERRRRAAPASFLNLQIEYPTGPLVENLSSLLERLRSLQSTGRDLERGMRDSVSDLYRGLMLLRDGAQKP